MELQLGSLDTSNCQLLLEREGREGTPVGPGVGGQAEPLTALSHSNFNPLYSSLHPPVPRVSLPLILESRWSVKVPALP